MAVVKMSLFLAINMMILISTILAAPTPAPKVNDPALRNAVLSAGRAWNRDFSHNLLQNIFNFNSQMRKYASTIPPSSSLHELVVPIHFTSSVSNTAAPYAIRHFVTNPIEKATVAVANWVDSLASQSDIVSSLISNTLGVTRPKPMIRRSINETNDSQ